MTPAAYDLAEQLYALAPWQWMDETMMVAMDDPGTGLRHHLSLMGQAGVHHALAVYVGPEARRQFNRLHAKRHDWAEPDCFRLLMEIPLIQCSFEQRAYLFRAELAALKAAGRKYRGETWPCLRSTRPGRTPAPVDDEDLNLLMLGLEQMMAAAVEIRKTGKARRIARGGQREILTRRAVNGVWESVWTPDDLSVSDFPQPAPDPGLVEKVRAHRTGLSIDVQFQIVPVPVGRSREEQTFPYLIIAIDPNGPAVVGCEMLSVEEQPHDQLIASVPNQLLKIFNEVEILPSRLRVASPLTHALLEKTAKALGIPIQLKSHLDVLDDAVSSLIDFLKRGG